MIVSNSIFYAKLFCELHHDHGHVEKELQVLASQIGDRLLSNFHSNYSDRNTREEEKKFIVHIFNPLLEFLKVEVSNRRAYVILKECVGPLGCSKEFNWYFSSVLVVIRQGINEHKGPPVEAFRCLAEFVKQRNKIQPRLLSKIDELCFSSVEHRFSECREGAMILWEAALASFSSENQSWPSCTLPLILSVVKRLETYDPEHRVSQRASKLLQYLSTVDVVDDLRTSTTTECFSLPGEERTEAEDLGDANFSLISSFEPEDSNEEEIEYFLRGSIPNPLRSSSQYDFQDNSMYARNEISAKLEALFDSYPQHVMDPKHRHIITDTIALLLKTAGNTGSLQSESLSQLVHEAYLECLYPYLAQNAKNMINYLTNQDYDPGTEVEILNEQIFQEAETKEIWFVRNVLPSLVMIIKSTCSCTIVS